MDTPRTDQSTKPLAGVRVLVLFAGDRMFGSECGNLEVFRSMAEQGLQAHFIVRRHHGEKEIIPALERMGFTWAFAPFGYHWGKYLFGRYFYYIFINLYGLVVTNWRLWREVRNWKPTHLYCINWVFFSYVLPVICWLRRPLIYRAGDDLPMHTRFHRWLVHKLTRRTDLAVCVSNHIYKDMATSGMSLEKMRVIYNYPPVRAASMKMKLPEVSSEAVVITFIGQLTEQKGVLVLFEAVERLIRNGRNVILWIAGNPVSEEGIAAALQTRSLVGDLQGRVVFLGFVADIPSLLAETDIHVCPSLVVEALSNVVLEAKQAGVPSVVFPTGGLPETITHGVDGFLCREHTVEALMEGIDFYINDAKRRQNAGDAARKSLNERFGRERFVKQWIEVFLAVPPRKLSNMSATK